MALVRCNSSAYCRACCRWGRIVEHWQQVLRLCLAPRVVPGPFVRVFTRCTSLRVIDVYHATDISDQLLGCIMLHVEQLEEFYASHRGGQLGCAHILSERMTRAFTEHYSSATISIDNFVEDAVLFRDLSFPASGRTCFGLRWLSLACEFTQKKAESVEVETAAAFESRIEAALASNRLPVLFTNHVV